MPVIQVTSGPMTSSQKSQLIERLTEISMTVTGTPEMGNSVHILELSLESMGIGKRSAARVLAEREKEK